ncbi:nicotinamide riboside transporter PnuC [Caldimonas tepidiphila]|uniref:nicotinamide riboside transporter PnuC n=1 Tax=Caldimonas tepidiphila TaxID=2315841 RepID=UPI000E5A349C|nr:nicotinamide riboside transporter PnuC [Caldimonas tepidiphila]
MNELYPLLEAMFAPAFTAWDAPVTWLEIAAFAMAVAMVVCNMRVNALAWPLAIGSSLLYFLLFWRYRLYGEAGLQLFFAAVAVWGWWQWLRGTQHDGRPLRVRALPARGRLAALAAALLAWPLLGLFLDRMSDSDVPWWDAFPTAASVLGQFLLARKYLENWPVWVVVNLVSVGLFAWKGLWLTVLLYALFVVMSFAGWRAWARLARGTA